jgi:hypothetical protein
VHSYNIRNVMIYITDKLINVALCGLLSGRSHIYCQDFHTFVVRTFTHLLSGRSHVCCQDVQTFVVRTFTRFGKILTKSDEIYAHKSREKQQAP